MKRTMNDKLNKKMMNIENYTPTDLSAGAMAKNMPQEKVDKLQAFFDGKRQVDADELIFDGKGLQILNKLIEIGRIKLPATDGEKPGFHAFWSSWNQPESSQSHNLLHLK